MSDDLQKRVAFLERRLGLSDDNDSKNWRKAEPAKDPTGLRRNDDRTVAPRKDYAAMRAEVAEAQPDPEKLRTAQLTAEFDQLTRGCFPSGSATREYELATYIESNGTFRPSRFRDPLGRIRDRDGNDAGREVAKNAAVQSEIEDIQNQLDNL